jgi:hypothetical protein
MFEFLKSKRFDTAFSFILGFGLIALFKPGCKDGECSIQKAPPYEEVKTSTYQVGNKCYKFEANPIECPSTGVIEPFQRYVRA